ncbi:MAG: hypothetical protein OES46_09930 [Gammaproteobacteria bacterium]|nr:hypothetical protein [Gammaproteobacteria bacterium]
MSHNTQQNAEVIPLPVQGTGCDAEVRQFERHVVKRNVVVIMPFGSENGTERQSILDLMRIKYIIEKVARVIPEGGVPNGPTIEYDVNIFREPVGRVPEGAVDTLATADVLIALLTARNVNVIYELAIRNLLKDEPILILQGKPSDVLPVYLQEMAYIQYDHDDSAMVIDQIKRIGEDTFPALTWKKPDQIPDALKQAIDASDYLIPELQDALQKLEDNPQRPPHFLRKHVIDLDPGRVLHSWSTYTPFSVLRIKWLRKRHRSRYDPADMIGEPMVYAANKDYLDMFDLKVYPFPDPDGENALTIADMIERLADYVEPKHYENFIDDQKHLTEKIIFNDRVGQAVVPIQFNNRHPIFAEEVYLPTLLGKRVVGSARSPHTVFLAIAFVKDFEPISDEELVNEGKKRVGP